MANYGRHYAEEDWTPSVDRAWDERTSYGLFDLPGRGKLVTYVQLTGNDQDLEVGFVFGDEDGDWTLGSGVELGPEWTTGGDWRVAGSGYFRMAGGGPEVDPSSLAALCRSALAALRAALI